VVATNWLLVVVEVTGTDQYGYDTAWCKGANLVAEGDEGDSLVGVGGGEGVDLVVHCCLHRLEQT
jgi:hypothetical protein